MLSFSGRGVVRPLVLIALCALASCSCGQRPPGLFHGLGPTPAAGTLGGPRVDLTSEQLVAFERGRLAFAKIFTPAMGLGPHYEATSCADCHDHPVVGGSSAYRRVLVSPGPPPQYEALHHPQFTLAGFPPRHVPPANATAKRPPPLFGVGLLEEVPDEVIIAGCDPEDLDGDGVRGRPMMFQGKLSRFGRKAHEYTIRDFSANALFDDLNVTSGVSDHYGQDTDNVRDPEVGEDYIDALRDYVRGLAPPPRAGTHPEGEAVFHRIGCGACHRADLSPTARGAYTDMCLHDMGPELSDHITDKGAGPQDYRTTPLWGLRLVNAFMHDGRAATVTEAVLLHGGEADGARTRFVSLADEERAALLAFLATL